MAKIGFTAEIPERETAEITYTAESAAAPRKSVVQVFFPARNRSYAYYNDRFDLHKGDSVYVEGKLEGLCGIVREVNYAFKIDLTLYKRVISLVDTNVHGKFFTARAHFVTFDRETLPREKIATWFKAPKEDTEIVCGSDDTVTLLDELEKFKADGSVKPLGNNYYCNNKVRYICISGTHGYAIVEGSEAHEVEFEYRNREVTNIVCSCFCAGACKHEFAALLQLKETLEFIAEHYADEYEKSDYFAAVYRNLLIEHTLNRKETFSFTL